jgi:hypothetical protein
MCTEGTVLAVYDLTTGLILDCISYPLRSHTHANSVLCQILMICTTKERAVKGHIIHFQTTILCRYFEKELEKCGIVDKVEIGYIKVSNIYSKSNVCVCELGHFLFFLCFASVQICETYPPARGKNKQALKTKLFLHVVWT